VGLIGTCLPSPRTGDTYNSDTRYHSLAVDRATLPPEFEVAAWTDRDELMGIRHKTMPLDGVQFHPESFLTTEGSRLIANFLRQ
jgi:anthranilate/para-aminobenzoate synthase component II